MDPSVPTASRVRPVDLDPKLVNSIGLHHSLASAIADLVDNCLDADAQQIRVRFLLDGTAPVGIRVVDDGKGMDAAAIDLAMTYAGTRAYDESDLGHFGVGLKAASLSQADTVLVCSRAYGSGAIGRKLQRSLTGGRPTVGDLSAADAAIRLAQVRACAQADIGTVIEWRNVRTFPSTSDDEERARWLEQAIREIRSHLGLVLHRVLGGDGPEVAVDTLEVVTGETGPMREVTPIDAFGYGRSGDPDFPQPLEIVMPDRSEPIRAVAHVWPPNSQDPGFKIAGDPGGEYQGFFVYRRNRLLQAGGWAGLWADRPAWALARVSIDMTESAAKHVAMNPEKSGIEFSADLRRALEASTCATTGHTFKEYLDRAAGEDRRSRLRERKPVTVVEPRMGLSPAVEDAFVDSVSFNPNYAPVDIRWRVLSLGTVFAVDLDSRELVLNLRHRAALVGRRSLDPNDAPVFKTLMFLLLERYFAGSHLGDREKREIEAWQQILIVATRAQAAESEQFLEEET